MFKGGINIDTTKKKLFRIIFILIMLLFMFKISYDFCINDNILSEDKKKACSSYEKKHFLKELVSNIMIINKVYAQNSQNNELQLIARAINGEARGEPYEGQVAVGAVILNRTRAPEFPNTVAGVIYQPGAFTAVSDGQINVPIDPESTVAKAAQDALNGWDPTNGCLYYWNPATATSKWIWSRQIVKKIGKHNFGK